MAKDTSAPQLFEDIKTEILKVDPVSFVENFLTVDGKPIKLGNGTGWKYLSDIYRYIGSDALKEDGKPIVCLKARQTGATIMATAIELYFCTSGMFGTSVEKPPISVLHCFPALGLVNKFSKNKLSNMMRTSKNGYVNSKSLSFDASGKRRSDVPEDTLTEKQFVNENKLTVDSNGNNAARLQSLTFDAIFFDEVQRMNADDIGNATKTLTAAKYGPVSKGVQLYFGTPLRRGSNFHKMWEASDKRYFYLKCEACNEHFMLYTPGTDDWENIWLYKNIVACTHCGHAQEKVPAVDRGKWIPSQTILPDGREPKYVGFFFNQLLIPYMTKEMILGEKPGIHPTNSDRLYRNDVLGEFYSGSDLPMSEEEIYEYCRDINGSITFGNSIEKSTGPKTITPYSSPMFMGVDWGGKVDGESTGKSYSSVVVVSVDSNGVLHVENAFKLKSNDFEHKKEVIAEMFRRFNIKLGVADLGYGSDIVPELQKEHGGRLIGSLSSGSLVSPVKYDPEELRIICNPHFILEELFGNMRKGKVMFPWKSYEQIHWLVEHVTSMEKEVKTVQGRVVTKYVKGATPNDGLMSLMYAYLAYKFYLTQGFKVKAHRVGTKEAGPIAAYLPGV